MIIMPGLRWSVFLHHEITELIHKNIVCAEKEGCHIVVIEVPLLFELDMKERFDRVVMVSSDRQLRVQRLMERDHITRDEAENLINVQMPDGEKIDQADDIVWNEDSKENLVASVDVLYKNLVKLQNN